MALLNSITRVLDILEDPFILLSLSLLLIFLVAWTIGMIFAGGMS